jgi:hypothetical protein
MKKKEVKENSVTKSYYLIVKKDILEYAGYPSNPVHFKSGVEIMVNEKVFEKLVNGETVEQHTQEGMVKFDKTNFEDVVTCRTKTVTYNTFNIN